MNRTLLAFALVFIAFASVAGAQTLPTCYIDTAKIFPNAFVTDVAPIPRTYDAEMINGNPVSGNYLANAVGHYSAVSPGALVSIIGVRLRSDGWNSAHRDVSGTTKIDGIEVLVNGVPTPIFYVGHRLDNNIYSIAADEFYIQIPYGIKGDTVSLQVRHSPPTVESSCVGNLVNLQLARSTPQLLRNGDGVIVQAQDRVATVYGSGFGDLADSLFPAGKMSEGPNPLRDPASFQVYVGGQLASLNYIGLAGGFPGLYQINFEIPFGGDTTVTLKVGEKVVDTFAARF